MGKFQVKALNPEAAQLENIFELRSFGIECFDLKFPHKLCNS